SELAKLCKEKLGWSRTTTYTVIKRLSERGVVKNENSIVTSLLSKDEIRRSDVAELLNTRFEGSLPAFVAAFSRVGNLSDNDIAEIQRIIERGRS
ncbi:MAG: BlaI/MecI/CopY family transcriptional regulator, partial [Clostridia bacterium]|nr:BlaI/MecI/CopY family transcriptional regulator [Clostridia bacterium]